MCRGGCTPRRAEQRGRWGRGVGEGALTGRPTAGRLRQDGGTQQWEVAARGGEVRLDPEGAGRPSCFWGDLIRNGCEQRRVQVSPRPPRDIYAICENTGLFPEPPWRRHGGTGSGSSSGTKDSGGKSSGLHRRRLSSVRTGRLPRATNPFGLRVSAALRFLPRTKPGRWK